jgi:hypothetical protein
MANKSVSKCRHKPNICTKCGNDYDLHHCPRESTANPPVRPRPSTRASVPPRTKLPKVSVPTPTPSVEAPTTTTIPRATGLTGRIGTTPTATPRKSLCGHWKPWVRMEGEHRCLDCSDVLKRFILECEDCHLNLCVSCTRNYPWLFDPEERRL